MGRDGGAVGKGRDDAAFDALFAELYPILVRSLTLAGGDAAADAVQDAFVQASLHWSRVSQLDNPSGWVWRVAVNRLANQRRGLRRRRAALERLEPPDDAGRAELDELDLDLAAAVRALPERQRTVTCLYYLADLPVGEVAEILGVSDGTVKSTLHDARAALKHKLGATHRG
jgi:RNA polymerase sigma-70 factor (ECF subfamily)